MKKKFLAIVVPLFTVGAAQASEVTLYGRLEPALQYLDANGNVPNGKPVTGLIEGGQAGSRFGFRGSEDLSADLSAIFTLEQGLNIDTGVQGDASRGAFNRQALLGLSSKKAGTLTLGRQYNATFGLVGTFSAFGNQWGLASQNVAFSNVFMRADNSVMYELPKSSPIEGRVLYSNDAGLEGVGVKSTLTSAAALYRYQPFAVIVGFDRANVQRGVGGTGGGAMTSWLTGLQWKSSFGVEAALMYGEDHNGRISSGAAGVTQFGVTTPLANATFDERFLSRTVLGSLKYVTGASSFMLSYMASTPHGTPGLARESIGAVGYRYDLSKRTNLWTTMAYARNGDYANNVDLKQVRLGMTHLF